MTTKLHMRLIEVGSEVTAAGLSQSYATFEGDGSLEARIPVTREEAIRLAPLIYSWCYVTIERSNAGSVG